jgi:hypothetical protein
MLKIGIVATAVLLAGRALAADVGAPTIVAPKGAAAWTDTITAGIQIEAGILANPANPADGQNFGQLYSDHANSVMLNQILMTLQRPLDPNAAGYDFGFMLQGLYGSDARYNHVLGFDDYLLNGRNQLVPMGIYILAHLPWLTVGGVDLKVGLTGGAMGYDSIDPSMRPFYTYGYISNYLVPFLHVGGIATWHVSDILDLYTGIDCGSQTSFGANDNNSLPAGYFGFGLKNLLDGKLNLLAMSRLGPEDSLLVFPNANSLMTSWNDVTVTYRHDDKWTISGEANFFYEGGIDNTAYGVAAYLTYAYSDQISFNARAEVVRDNAGSIVGNFIGADSYTNSIRGLPFGFIPAPAPTTYGEITLNVSFLPKIDWTQLDLPVKTLELRPEIRYDRSLNGTYAFNAGQDQGAFMFGGDIILGF